MSLKIICESQFCTGCKTCLTACRVSKGVGAMVSPLMIKTIETGEFKKSDNGTFVNDVKVKYEFSTCQHCENAKCMNICKNGAIEKDDIGIVYINYSKCTNCGECATACPSGAISLNDGKAPYKCDLCKERRDKGKEPVCVAACPSRLLNFNQQIKVLGW